MPSLCSRVVAPCCARWRAVLGGVLCWPVVLADRARRLCSPPCSLTARCTPGGGGVQALRGSCCGSPRRPRARVRCFSRQALGGVLSPPTSRVGSVSDRDVLHRLADLPGVHASVARARDACTALRWHPALRRRT